jgi:hypothetical protein
MIINGILSGAIILGEIRFYDLKGILIILTGAAISVFGILLMLYKHHTKAHCEVNPAFLLELTSPERNYS